MIRNTDPFLPMGVAFHASTPSKVLIQVPLSLLDLPVGYERSSLFLYLCGLEVLRHNSNRNLFSSAFMVPRYIRPSILPLLEPIPGPTTSFSHSFKKMMRLQ